VVNSLEMFEKISKIRHPPCLYLCYSRF